jgi:diguanylate cyclase (GGDEF)-like protein/PAS domain S-box-containing protein
MLKHDHDSVGTRPATWWLRLHASLMPDYNRKATAYWWCVTVLGAAALAWSIVQVAQLGWQAQLQVLVGTVIAAGAGFFPLRVPHSKNSFVAGEIFIFLLLLLHSPEAAAIAAAGESIVGVWRTSPRWTSRLISPAVAALSMIMVGTALHAVLEPLEKITQGLVLLAAMVFALAHFVATALLLSTVLRLKRNAPFDPRAIFQNFTWVGLTYAGSASVAALLYMSFKQTGVGVLLAGTPLLAMLLSTLHYYFRQQETAQAAQKTQIDAAMREAEVSARHMREMQESERRFHSAFTHASIGMALVTVDGRVLQANLALVSLLGRSAESLIGHDFAECVVPAERRLLNTQLERASRHEVETFGAELTCLHPLGRDVSISLHCSFFSEPNSSAPCLILQVQDVTARRQAENKLHHIAFHDGLTGLPNRSRFNHLLEQQVHETHADPSKAFAVMFIDCDRFKFINDSMGHSVGDEFLVAVARRIQERVRPDDVVARLGGDEFAILLRRVESVDAVTNLADRLLHALRQPVMHGETSLSSSVSIGVTFSSIGYDSREDVLRDADLAMYRAKAQGKDRYALFDEGMRAQTAHRMMLEQDLRQALADGGLSVAYQPLFGIRGGELKGFEALCRWVHPTLGPVPPVVFIPMAEEIGVVPDITEFVLRNATAQLSRWQLVDPSFAHLQMHINISGNDLAHSEFVNRVMRALTQSHLRPRHLVLELTENILMENIEGSFEVLAELRQLGVELAIDDFGTGYSSLSSLSRLPINSLKIDASFVRGMKPGSKQAEIVRAVVSLGASLGKSVIAEGIETESQMAMLDDMGCEGGQGYLLSEPLLADEVRALLHRNLIEVEHGVERFAGSEFSLTQH